MGSKGVGIVLVLLLGAGGWFVVNNITTKDSFQVAMAFGIPDDGAIEMNAIVSLAMEGLDPPRVDPKTMKVLWQEWADQHFDLRDAAGTSVDVFFRKGTERSIIPSGKILGAPQGHLFAKLQQGTDYTFDYVPKKNEDATYQLNFTAPTDDTPVERLVFDLS